MLSRTLKKMVLGAVATTAAIALAAVAMTGPGGANASAAQGYVAGAGDVHDDWNDEGTLSTNQHTHSNAVGLWQWVLYADGAIERDGTTFDKADIDCNFGPNTLAATKNWQKTHGFTGSDVDGIVGPKTFGKAGSNLDLFVATNDVVYTGKKNNFFMNRNEGKYEMDGARIVYSGFSDSFCSN